MPFNIVRNDITKMQVDAIVNAANVSLLGGGGVDGCIHRAAGPQLLAECKTLGGCPTGSARITNGYDLPCRFVIHAVGPIWAGGKSGEPELLASCYRESLMLAKEHGCESIAFPLISTGAYGYPRDLAMRIAIDTIYDFLLQEDMTIYLVIFDKLSFTIGEKLFADIEEFIDDHYAESYVGTISQRNTQLYSADASELSEKTSSEKQLLSQEAWGVCEQTIFSPDQYNDQLDSSVEYESFSVREEKIKAWMKQLDEGFSRSLLRLIDEKGMTDAECYKRANIDRKLFSKIRNDAQYHPSKQTVLAFAIALRLTLPETCELLSKAGFALSHSSKSDLIVEYFIRQGIYNVFEINEALFAFDQSLLGG